MSGNHSTAATTPSQPAAPTFPKADFKERNDNFVRAFKRINNIKAQSKLPSPTQLHDEWAIRQGWSVVDATTWRRLIDSARCASDDEAGKAVICLLRGTLLLADHCHGHPVGLLHVARTTFGHGVWNREALDDLTTNMLPSDVDDDWEATQPTTPPQSPSHEAPGAPKRLRRTFGDVYQPDADDDDDISDKN